MQVDEYQPFLSIHLYINIYNINFVLGLEAKLIQSAEEIVCDR